MRTSGWMKRQPWFWPIKLFLKRISGKELWLRPEVKYDVLQSDSWKYIPALLNEQSIVYSLGVGDLIDFDLDLINDYGANTARQIRVSSLGGSGRGWQSAFVSTRQYAWQGVGCDVDRRERCRGCRRLHRCACLYNSHDDGEARASPHRHAENRCRRSGVPHPGWPARRRQPAEAVAR